MKKVIKIILLVNIALVFSKCANQLPPSGGPIDKEPPEIIRVFPEQATTNFKYNFVEFEFDEYLNRNSLYNSIYITPYVQEDLEIKYFGKKIKIVFPQKLKDSTTYVLTLGTDITDLRGNKLANSYTLKFSTGDNIDDGSIQGKVYTNNPQGVMIYIYRINSKNDSVDYTSIKPDYVSQTSFGGDYFITGLPKGVFRVIAVRDQLKNFLYDINDDEIGLPFVDVILNDSIKIIEGIDFELTKIDTIKPVLTSVKQEGNKHLNLNFNEPIDLSSLNLRNIILTQVDSKKSIQPDFYFDKSPNAITLVFEKPVEAGNYELIVRGIKDLSENQNEFIRSEIEIEETNEIKSLNLISIQCNFSQNIVEYFKPEITLNFDDYVREESVKQAVTIVDTSNQSISFSLQQVSGNKFIVFPQCLKQREKYILKINFNFLEDVFGNTRDTTIVFNFETNSEGDYGVISGELKNAGSEDEFVIRVIELQTLKDKYKVHLKGHNKYQIKNIKPGSYFLKLDFETSEQKQKDIFSFSKPFIYFRDTIKVRARWPTTDVNFELKSLPRY